MKVLSVNEKGEEKLRIVLLGPPGAGKGTQAKMMEKDLGVSTLSTGDIIRLAIKNQTPWGKKAEEFVKSGRLVPDDVVIGIVKEKIDQDNLWSGFILDGFPRTIKQAEVLEEMLKEKGLSLDVVLYFAVDKEEVIKRLSSRRVCENCQTPYNLLSNPPQRDELCDRCGGKLIQRDDDKPEVIRKRLETYEEETKPLIDFYEERNLLRVIPSSAPIEEVYDRVKEALKEVAAGQ